ncbi:MAG: 30S ribosomal protein S3 [Candidatus Bathyarchaeota archaeon]|nr:MAG: 30S ribosomal protein S3 [Candidatus Bathyarchaeota archaeon]
MSVVKRIIKDNIERVKVDELLANEYEQAGYGGITLTKTPLGTQINLYAMRPGRVIGKRGRAIKEASERLENELGIPNPQITVVEVEVPELNPRIMAARIANALERGVHYRRALFWSLRRTMESGAIGCEILLKGKLRSDRGRYEKVSEGYIPKSGDPALKNVKSAVIHVKQKKGTFGVTVTIVPPEAKFPDKVDLSNLPVIEYPEEEIELPEGVEPELPEAEAEVVPTEIISAEETTPETSTEAEVEIPETVETDPTPDLEEKEKVPVETEVEAEPAEVPPIEQATPEPVPEPGETKATEESKDKPEKEQEETATPDSPSPEVEPEAALDSKVDEETGKKEDAEVAQASEKEAKGEEEE